MLSPRSSHADLPPILRRRLLVIAVLVALATVFFAVFRATQPGKRAYFRASPWTLRRLRVVVYALVIRLATDTTTGSPRTARTTT